jgi:hypothetical protein
MFMNVISNFAKLSHDTFIGPVFEWPPKIDTDDLSQDPGVDAFQVIWWK